VEQSRWTILCPCCDATLKIDRDTGAIISHEEKAKPIASFDEMAKTMERQREQRDRIFEQEVGSLKSRERILEEKFRDAMKRAGDDKDTPFRNPLDME
jgi:ribosome-associated translation inhibitor RaiA